MLKQPGIQANDAGTLSGVERFNNMLGALKSNAYLVFKGIDFTGIKKVTTMWRKTTRLCSIYTLIHLRAVGKHA